MATEKKKELIFGDEVKYHTDPSRNDMVLPMNMTPRRAYDVLERLERARETVEQLEPEKFPNRPNDVYVAVSRVIQRRYGVTISAGTASLFGEDPPTFKSVPVGLRETVEVATGRILIPHLDRAEIFIGEATDRKLGTVGAITATMKRKDRDEVHELLADIRQELKEHSIYRGKALKINGDTEPQFMDTSKFPTFAQLVYSEQAMTDIAGSVLNRIRHRVEAEAEGIPFKSTHLMEGPFGTGKTSGIQASALEALANGITVVFAEPGANLRQLIQTAELYGPAVAAIEDIDTVASTGEDDAVSEVLDVFDGVDRKNGSVMVIMTTNRVETLHKGFLRAGRCDTIIHIGHLDRPGLEKLVRQSVAEGKLDPDVDYDALFEACQGYTPSFIAEVLHRAKLYAIGRNAGSRDYILVTEDLVGAAHSLRGHFNLMRDATEGKRKPTLDQVFDDKVERAAQLAVHGVPLVRDGDMELGKLHVEALES